MTALQYLLELQRDWVRNETCAMTTLVAAAFAGAYGLSLIYAKTMLGPPAAKPVTQPDRRTCNSGRWQARAPPHEAGERT